MGSRTCAYWQACVIAFFASIFALIATASGAPEPHPRGLILITVDTLRADHVGGYGNLGLTPNIDALAARGVRIEHMSTPTPTTGPAHASLFTGHHPWRHGVLDNAVAFDVPRGHALAEVLKADGFTTAGFVSSYVLDPRFRFDRGFDDYWFEPTNSYTWMGEFVEAFWARGEQTSNAAMHWLAKRASGTDRFFLWVHYFDPHSPYAPPAEFTYAPKAEVDLENKKLPPQTKSWGELRNLIQAYRGEVRYVDKHVGRLLDRVRILGLADDVAIVLTSDHGEGLGDHGHLEHGRNLHRELLRVPLIVAGPGIPKGERLPGPVQLEDLYPTVLSLLAVETKSANDGIDLTPWLKGTSATPPREALYGRRKFYEGQPDLYFREVGTSKWIGTLDKGGVEYEVESDPKELTGSGGKPAPGDLTERVERDRRPDPGRRQLDEDAERALRALGYIE